MPSNKDPLLQSFYLKHLKLKNRIISTAHAPSFADNGHPREVYQRYHEEKALGGVALTMVGGSTNVSLDSPSVFGQLYAGDDAIIPWFNKLTDSVHRHGTAIICQITHMGRRTAWDHGHWLPVIGPSHQRERAHRAFPKAMETEDFKRVVSDFTAAAIRCQKGGFDGIELLAHSHLLGQLMSPELNDRCDQYGGNIDNRLRLTTETLESIRHVVGDNFIIGIRLTGTELTEAGLTLSEGLAIAQKLESHGCIDFINVMAGAPYDDLGLATWIPPMGVAGAAHINIAGEIRNAVSLPILHAGGISDLATARYAVNKGLIDLVGMTRAQIADPYLVSKLEQRKEERIKPCVGLGYCVDRVNQGKPAVCGHNPATGREISLSHKTTKTNQPKKTIVVGAGPAGLEAARVLAERGHHVILFEATDRLGGQLHLASKSTLRKQITGISDWLIQELTHLRVDIRINTYVDAEDIISEDADLVIIATGGWPEKPNILGAQYTTSSWDVLNGETRPQGKVFLFDTVGDQASANTAEYLTQIGCDVDLLTPDRCALIQLGPTTSSVALKQLTLNNVDFHTLQEIIAVEKIDTELRLTIRNVLTGKTHVKNAHYLVIEQGTRPMDHLYHKLKPLSKNKGQVNHNKLIEGQNPFESIDEPKGNKSFNLARIGDAISSRNIHAAMLDALRHCQQY